MKTWLSNLGLSVKFLWLYFIWSVYHRPVSNTKNWWKEWSTAGTPDPNALPMQRLRWTTENGKTVFYNEIRGKEHGPYDSKEQAKEAGDLIARTLTSA